MNAQTKEPITVILDSNIIQHLGNKDLKYPILEYLLHLETQNCIYRISGISITECLSGLAKNKEEETIKFLNFFPPFEIDKGILIGSARIQNLYIKEGFNTSQFSIGDRIIATTSVITGSLILTGNYNDFPRPFFKEVEMKDIEYKKKDRRQVINLGLLVPNIDYINKSLQELGYPNSS